MGGGCSTPSSAHGTAANKAATPSRSQHPLTKPSTASHASLDVTSVDEAQKNTPDDARRGASERATRLPVEMTELPLPSPATHSPSFSPQKPHHAAAQTPSRAGKPPALPVRPLPHTSLSPLSAARKAVPVPSAVHVISPRTSPTSLATKSQAPVVPAARRPGSGSARRAPRVGGTDAVVNPGLPRAPERVHNGFTVPVQPHLRHGSTTSANSSTGAPRTLHPNPSYDEYARMVRPSSARGSLLGGSQTGERPGSSMRRLNSQISFTCSEEQESGTIPVVCRSSPSQNSIMVHEGSFAQRITPVNGPLRTSLTTTFGTKGFRKSQADDDEASITRVKAMMHRRRAGESRAGSTSLSSIMGPLADHSPQDEVLGTQPDEALEPRLSLHRPSRRSPMVRCIDAPELAAPHVLSPPPT